MKKILSIAAAIAVASSLAACASDSASAGKSAETEILLPFPEGLPLAPITVAKQQGLFAKNGIDNLKVSVAEGSGYVSQQLVAGNVNFALMGSADIAVAASKRDDVRVLFCHQAHNVYRIAALKDSGINDLAGLKGKSLGITEPGGGENQLVKAALAEAGLTDSVTTLPIGGAGPQSLSAIKDGKVQAYSSSYPDFVALGAEGVEFVDVTPEKYSSVPGTCMATTQKFLDTEEGKKQANAVTKSWIDAEYFTLEKHEEAFDLVCKALPSACENKDAAKALFAEAVKVMAPNEGDRPGDTTPEVWKTVVEILSGSGAVPASLDMSSKVSGGVVQQVRDAAFAGR
jgi:NitT/TauT family transport system substrate-binding protein